MSKMKGKKCKKRNYLKKINKISWTKIMIGIYSAAIFSIFLISIGQDTSDIVSIFNLKINFNYILCGIILLFSTKYIFNTLKKEKDHLNLIENIIGNFVMLCLIALLTIVIKMFS